MITFNSLVSRAKILNEANLYNKNDLENAVYSVISSWDDKPEIKTWFRQKYIPWYCTPDGDSEKNTAPYSWKEGDHDWAKDKADLVTFRELTSSEKSNIRDIAEYLETLPINIVNKITYPKAIEGVENDRTPSATSHKWGSRVKKFIEEINIRLDRNDLERYPNATQWFRVNFMRYFLEECPGFNVTSGIDDLWNTKIETLMHYISGEQSIDEGFTHSLIQDNVDPEILMREAEASNSKFTLSNIKPLTEGIDYIKFDPLYNYKASADNKDSYDQFIDLMRKGGYKFIRLLTQKSFVNEGEKLQHCVKSDHYARAEEHTLISLWRRDKSTGDPYATMEFDIKGKDLTPSTKSMIKASREADQARTKLEKLSKELQSLTELEILTDDQITKVRELKQAVQAAKQALQSAEQAADKATRKAVPITDNTTEWTTMTQCKGQGNRAPEEKRVQTILRKFVTLNDINITQDGEKIGLRQWLRQFYDPDSLKWRQVYNDQIIPAQNARFKEIKMRIIDADTGKQVYPNG